MNSNQKYRRYFAISILFVSIFFVRGNDLFANNSNSFFNEQSDNLGNITSLMNSAIDGDSATTQVLINSGADVNAKNIGGATALHIAARMNNVDVIETLIKNGAKINAKDNDGWTPLMRASLAGNKEAVNSLLNNGASIWLENRWDESALIHASVSNCEKCTESIIEKVDFSNVNKKKLVKINEQIDESISISKKRQNSNVEKVLTSFSKKLNKKDEDIMNDGKEKIYKLKESDKIVKPGIVVERGSKNGVKGVNKEKVNDLKISDKAEIKEVNDAVEPEGLVDEEQKINYSFTGKKIDKTKKSGREKVSRIKDEALIDAIVDDISSSISEKKEEKEKTYSAKNIEKDDSEDEVINLNSDDWKNEVETKKSKGKKYKNESKKLNLDNKEEKDDNKEGEIKKLFIFTGDEKSLLEKRESNFKEPSQTVPRYNDNSGNQKYEAEVFEKGSKKYKLKSDDEEAINLNKIDSNKDIKTNKSVNEIEKIYIFSGREESSSGLLKKKSYFLKK